MCPSHPGLYKKRKEKGLGRVDALLPQSSLDFFSSLVPPADSLKQATVLFHNPNIILTMPKYVLGASLKRVRHVMLSF